LRFPPARPTSFSPFLPEAWRRRASLPRPTDEVEAPVWSPRPEPYKVSHVLDDEYSSSVWKTPPFFIRRVPVAQWTYPQWGSPH